MSDSEAFLHTHEGSKIIMILRAESLNQTLLWDYNKIIMSHKNAFQDFYYYDLQCMLVNQIFKNKEILHMWGDYHPSFLLTTEQ